VLLLFIEAETSSVSLVTGGPIGDRKYDDVAVGSEFAKSLWGSFLSRDKIGSSGEMSKVSTPALTLFQWNRMIFFKTRKKSRGGKSCLPDHESASMKMNRL
jgi:hypothetical protein